MLDKHQILRLSCLEMEHDSTEESQYHSDASEHGGNRSETSLDFDSFDEILSLKRYERMQPIF